MYGEKIEVKSICAFCICNECYRSWGNIRNMWHLNIKSGFERVQWVEKYVRSADNGAVCIEYH
jgi:hypothetical protein